MPAQSAEGQIPVPVFRMLGSDPIGQYDDGIADSHQGVITLEPVYKFGEGDAVWGNWLLKTLTVLGFGSEYLNQIEINNGYLLDIINSSNSSWWQHLCLNCYWNYSVFIA